MADDTETLYKQLDAAITLGVRKDWEFRNSETGQHFILSLKPIGDPNG